jgi:hypothetical protein
MDFGGSRALHLVYTREAPRLKQKSVLSSGAMPCLGTRSILEDRMLSSHVWVNQPDIYWVQTRAGRVVQNMGGRGFDSWSDPFLM